MEGQALYYNTDLNRELKLTGFTVYEVKHEDYEFRFYNRKDFFKICIMTGNHVIHYADRTFEVDGTVLFFGNPLVPYSWEIVSSAFNGYTCLFSEGFMKPGERTESLLRSPLFKIGGTPVFNLNDQQASEINGIFRKMISETESDYTYKSELISNYIQLIIHEALKMHPSGDHSAHKNAARRITSVFLELLERQFPVESTAHTLKLRTAKDFAESLSVHVNYLNRSVKEVTGKPTSIHISERIIREAKALLQHTDWNISEIAFALGFKYPTYFNNFFKKMTGTNPKSLRTLKV